MNPPINSLIRVKTLKGQWQVISHDGDWLNVRAPGDTSNGVLPVLASWVKKAKS